MGQADCSSQDTPVTTTEATFASKEVSDPIRTVMPPMWCPCHPAPCAYVVRSINSRLPEPGPSFGANLVTTDTVLMDNHDGGSYMKSAEDN
jgi:hypothetical protein